MSQAQLDEATEPHPAGLSAGSRVRLEDGRAGTLMALYREQGCRCRSAVVRLDSGREWAGKASEVLPWP